MPKLYPVLFLLLWFGDTAVSEAQELLPNAIHVFLVKGRAAAHLSFAAELARLDSLQLKAIDSLHSTYPWFTYEVADSAQHSPPEIPALNLCYEVTTDPHAPPRNILMGMPEDAFLFTIRRETLDAGSESILGRSAENMKDLEGYLQPGPLIGALYGDIYNKLASDITTYVIDTKAVLSPKFSPHRGITIAYHGITGPTALSAREKLLINGFINNSLVAGQLHYDFDYIPSWQSSRTDTKLAPDSLIDLRLSATDSAGFVTFHLDFSAHLPLRYQSPAGRNGATTGVELTRSFSIPAQQLVSGNYSALIFPMGKSLAKFFSLNLPARK
jgi:hypothetical protein